MPIRTARFVAQRSMSGGEAAIAIGASGMPSARRAGIAEGGWWTRQASCTPMRERPAWYSGCPNEAIPAEAGGAAMSTPKKTNPPDMGWRILLAGGAAPVRVTAAGKRPESIHLLREHLHAKTLAEAGFSSLLLALALGRGLLVSGTALELNDQASLENGPTETPHCDINGLTGFQYDLSQFCPLSCRAGGGFKRGIAGCSGACSALSRLVLHSLVI